MIAGAIYGFDAIPNWMIEGLQWGRQIREYTIGLLQVANKTTLREELQRVSETLLDIQGPEAGKTYEVAGHSCLCIHPLASYGGGAATLWAGGPFGSTNPCWTHGWIYPGKVYSHN